MERIFKLLEGSQSPEGGQRRLAEANLLHEMGSPESNGFASNLIGIGLAEGIAPHFRQLAMVFLRRLVKESWDKLTESETNYIRGAIARGLFCGHTRVANSFGVVIAEIAEWDFPHAWPTLLTDLCRTINDCHDNHTTTYACVKCLQLLTEEGDERDMVTLIPVVGLMARIFQDTRFATNVRVRAMRTLRNLIVVAQNSEAGSKEREALVAEIGPHARSIVTAALLPGTGPDLFLVWEALSLVRVLVAVFPRQSDGIIEYAVPELLSRLSAAQESILTRFANTTQESAWDAEYTSEGEEVSEEVLTYRRLELLHGLLTTSKKLASHVWGFLGANLDALVELLLRYVTLPSATLSQWRCDVNAFLLDTDLTEEGASTEIRGLSLEILRVVSEKDLGLVMRHATDLLSSTSLGSSPVMVEVGVATISTLAVTKLRPMMSGNPTEFDRVLTSLASDVLPNLPLSDDTFLLTSTLLFFQRVLEHDQSKTAPARATTLVRAMALVLHAAVQPAPSRPPMFLLATCFRTLFIGKVTLGAVDAQNLLHAVMTLLCDPDVQGEVHVLVLDTLNFIIARHRDEINVSDVPRGLIDSWMQHPSKSTSDIYVGLFHEVARSPSAERQLVEYVLPWAQKVLDGVVCVPPGFTTHIVSILSAFAKHVDDALFLRILESFFAPVCTFILVSDESDAVQAGSLCLRVFVRRGGNHLTQVKLPVMVSILERCLPGLDETPVLTPALPVLFRVLESLFTDDRGSDSALLYAGSIVQEIIRDMRSALSTHDITVMLGFVVRAAASLKNIAVAQEMLVAIARVFLMFPEDVVGFLVANNAAGLVLPKWVEQHIDFYGDSDFCVSTMALCGILRSQDGRLGGIEVPFFIVAQDSARRVLRSSGESKKNIRLPLPAAVFAVLAKTLLRMDAEVAREEPQGGRDDEKEWCNESGSSGSGEGSEESEENGVFLSDLIGDDDDEEGGDHLVLAERQGAPSDTDDAFFKNDPPMTRSQLCVMLREVLGP